MEFFSELHPLVVHFPIVLFFLYIFIEVINLFIKKNELEKIILSFLVIGVIGGIVSVLSGNQAFQYLSESSLLTQYHIYFIKKHEYFASITMWYFFAVLVIKIYFFLSKENDTRLHYLFIIFAFGGSVLLYKTAEWGGKLVYKFGIGTELIK